MIVIDLVSRFGRFLKSLVCFPKKFTTYDRSSIGTKKNSIRRMTYDRPGRHHSDFYTRRESDTDSSKLQLSTDELILRERLLAAIVIQRVIRGYLGRARKKRILVAAFEDAKQYWNNYYANISWEKEKRKIASRERAKLAKSWVNDVLLHVQMSILREHSAIIIQRLWRGYWTRKHLPVRFPKPTRPKTTIHRRFAHETLRRVWARRRFQPEGGWPGRSDILPYDMWSHTDKPPAGRSYGLRTHKIRAVPKTPKQEVILKNDVNSWYGTPIAYISADEAKPNVPGEVLAMKYSSPYSHMQTPATAKRSTRVTYDSLGWTSLHVASTPTPSSQPSTRDTRTPSRGATKPSSRSYYPAYNPHIAASKTKISVEDGTTPRGNATFTASTLPDPASSTETLNKSSTPGVLQDSLLSQNYSNNSARNSRQWHLYSGADDSLDNDGSSANKGDVNYSGQRSPRKRRRGDTIVARTRTADAQYWTPHPKTGSGSVPVLDEDSRYWAHTAWGRLKTVTDDQLAARTAKGLQMTALSSMNQMTASKDISSRVKVWPTVARKHYKLRYTWMPQPLVSTAVNKIYNDRLGDLSNQADVNCNDISNISAEPSIYDIENEYRMNSLEYYSMEADLVSGDCRRKQIISISNSKGSSIYHPDFG